ncbi:MULTISPECIES: hypothetical protein [unclassified Lonepinella]|uniref:hypothetical protein n=1 Tax=unclassified Lonepinella TaxID=2642006 RepID=UPI0036DF682A
MRKKNRTSLTNQKIKQEYVNLSSIKNRQSKMRSNLSKLNHNDESVAILAGSLKWLNLDFD